MNIASRILVTKQDNIKGRRGGEKWKSQGGAFLNYSQRVLVESVVAVGGGVVVVVPISWARRDATPRFTLAKVLWVSLLPTLFADRTLLAAAYALHVSELCTLWIFNELYATFFPDRYRKTARKNIRTLRSELIYETGRMWRLNVARFRCT